MESKDGDQRMWILRYPIVLVMQWYLKLKHWTLKTPQRYAQHQKEFFRLKMLEDGSDKFSGIRARVVAHALEEGKVIRALDVCTGHGFQARALKDAGIPEVAAIDLVPERVAYSEKRSAGQGIDFMLMDATTIAYPESHFDCATISAGLHDMPSSVRRKAIQEVARVTKGRIVIFEPRIFRNPIVRVCYGLMGALLDESLSFREYQQDGLAPLLQESGVEVIREEHVWGGVMTITVCRRR